MRRYFHLLTVILVANFLLRSSSATKIVGRKRRSKNPVVKFFRWTGDKLHGWPAGIASIQREFNAMLRSKTRAIDLNTLKFLRRIKIKRIVIIQPDGMSGEAFGEMVQEHLVPIFENVVSRPREYIGEFSLKRLLKNFSPLTKTLVIGSDVDQLIAAFEKRYLVALSDMKFHNFELRKLKIDCLLSSYTD